MFNEKYLKFKEIYLYSIKHLDLIKKYLYSMENI